MKLSARNQLQGRVVDVPRGPGHVKGQDRSRRRVLRGYQGIVGDDRR